ncbi:MAG TPA: 23S rRNA (adenine(2503)-C(2))-methyltransferase RlmN [Lachnospiraceae bacterium]|nr:23S rRNA (adenine(2503)-C(2))-methyltransferase RlmN [Lachnospiraceae bacterium]
MDLTQMTLPELREYLVSAGEKPFRAGQIYEWLNIKNAFSYDEMTNLPKPLRERLGREAPLKAPEKLTVQVSGIDGTRKYLFGLYDGSTVESVLMKYRYGNSVCISSQVGCRMGCRFCASTLLGLTRNLTAGEMLGQIYAIERDISERVSNVVVMGTGEPLDNYDHLVRFLRMISDADGHNISERNLTVSTCGLVPGILKLKDEKLAISLALSLHAPTDALRRQLMPVAAGYPLEEIMSAMKEYYEVNRRRLTFEYSLMRGINDSDACAEELGRLVRGMNCLVNLIPVNPVKETDFRAPSGAAIAAFKKKLEKYGINVTIRREMGRDIDGACGQLRKRYAETEHI